jgi:phosphohistidine phosphatase SixA
MEVILLRHADAVAARGGEPDWSRPLSAKGEGQAQALAGALGAWTVAEILSSPATRCRATVAWVALRQGVEVSEDVFLAEAIPDPYELATFCDRLEASIGGVLVCGHAPALSRLLALLAARHELVLPQGELALRPATAVVLSYGAGPPRRLKSLVRLDPPKWPPRRLLG